MKKHIPNFFTSLNLFCGVVAIIFALKGDFDMVLALTAVSLVSDFLDGFLARLLGVQGPMGKELDSLADAVTFGVLPGFVIYQMVRESNPAFAQEEFTLALLAFLIPVLAALRLAKFNIDTEQSTYFKGLPTPAYTMMIITLPYVREISWMEDMLNNYAVLLGFSIGMGLLMVSNIPLMALKFKSKKLADNWDKAMLILGSGIILLTMSFKGVPIILLLYLVLSLVFRKKILNS